MEMGLLKTSTNLRTWRRNTSNYLTFLMRCRDAKLIPNSLKLKHHLKTGEVQKILDKASHLIMKERIKHHRRIKSTHIQKITELQKKIETTLDDHSYKTLRQMQNLSNNALDQRIKTTHVKKTQQSEAASSLH